MSHTKRKHCKKRITKKYKKNKVKRITKQMFERLDKMSPFELSVKLIDMAGPNALNAGRGNPNFFNSFCRTVFAKLQLVVLELSTKIHKNTRTYPLKGQMNFYNELVKCTNKWESHEKLFIQNYFKHLARKAKQSGENVDDIMLDLIKSTLGCFYPVPPQIQPHLNLIAQDFLYKLVMSAGKSHDKGMSLKPNDFEIFATEGAAAGILYVFNTLKENYFLLPHDKIAIVTPIFSPYLEMPKLADYQLEIVELKCDPNKQYSLSDSEIDKLKDKKIKALFMVNPANPGAYSLTKDNIDKIGHIVNTERQDLIVLSDNVYAPFADEYNSFMLSCPYNTIEVYSLSKYFGTTGWRLGLCMVAKKNKMNLLLANAHKKYKNALNKRYETATINPSKLTFMDRIVFDSRQVAEAHVGGLSTPQQTLIGLMLYYDVHDSEIGEPYRNSIKSILRNRIKLFYKQFNIDFKIQPTQTDYYNLLDIPEITKSMYGEKAQQYLLNNYEYLEFLFHLCSVYHTILLPGSGFGATPWKLRISLANLDDNDYVQIGKNIRKAIKDLIEPSL